jgi:hypothetical protein
MRTLPSPVDEVVRNVRGAGLGAVREFLSRSYLRYGRSLRSDPVFEADWDLLVVLDACRADLWAETVDDFDLPVGETRVSPGGTSTEWLDAVFGRRDGDELADLAYVTANPYSASHVDAGRFARVAEVWRDGWDDDLGTAPPRPVTDAAVTVGRSQDPGRLVVHYMQPHFPSLADDRDDGITLDAFGEESLSVWEDLRFGNRSVDDVWAAYRRNLEIVLEDVELLLSNVDAERAVVTADHGNAVGEWGIYGHAEGVALPPLREVPWVPTSATDEGTYEPERELDGSDTGGSDDVDADVEERLRRLGYR